MRFQDKFRRANTQDRASFINGSAYVVLDADVTPEHPITVVLEAVHVKKPLFLDIGLTPAEAVELHSQLGEVIARYAKRTQEPWHKEAS